MTTIDMHAKHPNGQTSSEERFHRPPGKQRNLHKSDPHAEGASVVSVGDRVRIEGQDYLYLGRTGDGRHALARCDASGVNREARPKLLIVAQLGPCCGAGTEPADPGFQILPRAPAWPANDPG